MRRNKFYLLPAFLILLLLLSCSKKHEESKNSAKNTPADLADPQIDTRNPRTRYDYFATAAVPFGMVSLHPDTRHNGRLWGSGYLYGEEYILNFAHVHNTQTAGIPVMPVTGKCMGHLGLEQNKSRFSHDKEIARPGYHKLFLEDDRIWAELTATNRVGMHRYTFPASEKAHILIDLGAELGPTAMLYAFGKKVSDSEIEGYSIMAPTFRRKKPYTVHFVARFSRPFQDFAGWQMDDNTGIKRLVKPEAGIVKGQGSGVYVSYHDLYEGETLLVKVAVSYVSAHKARLNMESELSHWDFEQVVIEAKDQWNAFLGRIKVEGGTHEQQVKLYTDLMHTAIGKRITNDVDGAYMDYTGAVPVLRQVPADETGKPAREVLDGDGLWGAHWNLNILWSLIYPEYGNWVAETFLDYYRHAGTLARTSWGGNYAYVMIGDHTTPLLAALMSTNRATFNEEVAYAGSRKNAFPGGIRDRAGYEAGPDPSGGGIDWYIDLGYVPAEIRERGSGFHRAGAAMTLEYAYQDWCLSVMADRLGKPEDAALFRKRSGNWKNVFDANAGWVRPRHASGEWVEPFAPVSREPAGHYPGFVEANSAVYTFYVPHDIEGLSSAMGGREALVEKLESNFEKAREHGYVLPHGERAAGWVAYENQPSGALAHLFSHAGAPSLTQYYVREIKEVVYGGADHTGGYQGDEDQGQMGALGTLMAIGLFDVQGLVGEDPTLEITSPVFDRIMIDFPSLEDPNRFNRFEIVVTKEKETDIYIREVLLNGEVLNGFEFPVSEFFAGGKLEITLGSDPQPL